MSKIGMKHLSKNPHCYNGLAFGKGGLTSSTSPLWSPHGAYNFGGFYGEADAAANDAPNQAKSSGLMDMLKSPIVLALLGIGGYMFYKNMKKGQTALNPRRKRRNGTKKGMRRKTARRAYMKKNALKTNRRRKNASAHQKRAKKAMQLYHSGKAKSLKAAWKMV